MTNFVFRALVATVLVSASGNGDKAVATSLPCECSGSGDPHLITCDGTKFDYMGKCVYVTAETCGVKTPKFKIEESHQDYIGNPKAATTKELFIHLSDGNKDDNYNVVVKFLRDKKVILNETLVTLPVSKTGYDITFVGHEVLLETEFGLKVYWNGEYNWRVIIPNDYKDQICGLCGKWDGIRSNDFTLRDKSMTNNANKFGNSWTASGYGCAGEPKEPEDKGADHPCTRTVFKNDAQLKCALLNDKNGPLKSCFSVVKNENGYETCQTDVCLAKEGKASPLEITDVTCQNIEGYVEKCMAAGGKVGVWRQTTFCPLKCVQNAHYSKSMSPCQRTCRGDSPVGSLANCPLENVEGCECNTGFILSGEECVNQNQCGCVDDKNNYYMPGEETVSEECISMCKCNTGGKLTCTAYSCKAYEKCTIEEGVRGCRETVEVGNTCPAGWDVKTRGGPDRNGLTMVSPDKKISCNGVINQWRYQSKASHPFRAVVWRPVAGSPTKFKIVGINNIPAGTKDRPVAYTVPQNERIQVEAGDVIGWSFGDGGLAWNKGGINLVRWVGGKLHQQLKKEQTRDINGGSGKQEYSIEAIVERGKTVEVVDPVKPVVDPEKPVVDPVEPTGVESEESKVDPVKPVVDPKKPVVDPVEPTGVESEESKDDKTPGFNTPTTIDDPEMKIPVGRKPKTFVASTKLEKNGFKLPEVLPKLVLINDAAYIKVKPVGRIIFILSPTSTAAVLYYEIIIGQINAEGTYETVIRRSDYEVDPVVLPAEQSPLKPKQATIIFITLKPGMIAIGIGIEKNPILVFHDKTIETLPYIAFGGGLDEPAEFIFEKGALVSDK